jgi:5'-phosphate synthase pdxT subunit
VRRVGVLALQGDVREHVAMLGRVGAEPVPVRTTDDLASVEALVLPGGESTTMARLLTTSGLREPVAQRLADGMPALGTCAGLILLARQVLDGRHDQWSFGALDLVVTRNGYGRQIASFETTLRVAGVGEVPGVFIRAPRIESWASGVEVMAWHDHGDGERPVLVREGPVWGACFHPELTSDDRLHRRFVEGL